MIEELITGSLMYVFYFTNNGLILFFLIHFLYWEHLGVWICISCIPMFQNIGGKTKLRFQNSGSDANIGKDF